MRESETKLQATHDDARFQLDAKAALQTFRLLLAGAAWVENQKENVPQTGTGNSEIRVQGGLWKNMLAEMIAANTCGGNMYKV
jgi:hypothetical protein